MIGIRRHTRRTLADRSQLLSAQALADPLIDVPDDRRRIRAGDYRLEFLAYDWSLNDARAPD